MKLENEGTKAFMNKAGTHLEMGTERKGGERADICWRAEAPKDWDVALRFLSMQMRS